MLKLNGLSIATINYGAAAGSVGDSGADIVWRTHRVDTLPAEPEGGDPIAIVRREQAGHESAIEHIFGYDGHVRCRFRINRDGSLVECWAVPDVSDRDLFSLFAEPVMRTILVLRGLLSFHSAALVKNGRAILIMANKGAGKSTLSWALQRQGWQLFSDDLARVESIHGQWSVFPGHRQTKLTPTAARAFGHAADAMPVRFDDSGPAAYAALFDKGVIEPADALADPDTAVFVAALFFLNARDPSARAIHIESLSPSATVRHLLQHATPEPLGPAPAIDSILQRAVGLLATQVNSAALTLPDHFDRLEDAAAALEPLVSGMTARA